MIGLNFFGLLFKLIFVLMIVLFEVVFGKDESVYVVLEMDKVFILFIDDVMVLDMFGVLFVLK